MTLFQCEIRILFSFQRVVIPSQEGVYHLILDSQQEIMGLTMLIPIMQEFLTVF